MQFLKKHYEKIVLSVVLLGLAAAAAALPIMVGQEREKIEDLLRTLVKTKAKPWEVVNLTTNQAAVRRIEGPLRFKLWGEHNLFNPVRWIRLAGKPPIKITREDQIGPSAVVVTKITPLHLIVTFEEVSTANEKIQYKVSILRQPGPLVSATVPERVQQANFIITKVDGPPEAPTALHVLLKGEKEGIVVRKDKPSTRVIGYLADLVYPPDNNRSFPNKKKGDKITLRDEPDPYKVFDITESEVVLSSDKGKKTSIQLNPSATQ